MFKNFRERVSEEPVVFMFRKMWEFRGDLTGRMILMWSMSIASRLIWMSPIFILGLLLNEIQNNGVSAGSINYVLLLIFAIFSVNLFAWCLHGPSRVIERLIGYRIDRYYKKYLYNAVASLPLTWHTDHDSGDTIDKVNKATESLFNFSRSTFMLVTVLVRIVAITGALMFFSVPVAVLAISFLIFGVYILLKFDKVLIPQYRRINEYDNKATAKVYDALSNVTTVKVLSIEKPILEGIDNSWWASYKLYIKNKILVEWKWFTGSTIFNFLVTVPLAVYVVYEYRTGGVVLVGTISTMYLYLKDFAEVYHIIAGNYDDISIQKSRIQGVEEIEGSFNKISKVRKKNFKGWGSINIENLKFKYDENLEVQSLDVNNLVIKKGEKIALIGESGSGKSTILKILHGMYESAIANISVEIEEKGKVIKKNLMTNFVDINLQSTLVPQEPEVFSASIKENITLLLNFNNEEIDQATKMAEFYEVAEGLPNGLDSVVNEKGVNLSGGQKQRLALSRALLFSAEKEIILLDESTSSVDPVNEVKIYKNIFENFPGVTILASIHKMNLLKYFDRIIILEDGRIKIQGNFDYLLENDAEFSLAWDEFVKENN